MPFNGVAALLGVKIATDGDSKFLSRKLVQKLAQEPFLLHILSLFLFEPIQKPQTLQHLYGSLFSHRLLE